MPAGTGRTSPIVGQGTVTAVRPGRLGFGGRLYILAMASPQTGIFALGAASHAYLEFDAHAAADASSVVGRVARLREPRTRAVSGAYYVVPSAERLAAFGGQQRTGSGDPSRTA